MTDSDATKVIRSQQTRKFKNTELPIEFSNKWIPGVKSFLCITALLLILYNGNVSCYRTIDNYLFSISSGLKSKVDSKKKIIKINLSSEEMHLLRNAPVNLKAFSRLLNVFEKNKPLVSALFIDSYPDSSENRYINSLSEKLTQLQQKLNPPDKNSIIMLRKLIENGKSGIFFSAVKKSGLNIVLPVEKLKDQGEYVLGKFNIHANIGVKNGAGSGILEKMPMSAFSHKMPAIQDLKFRNGFDISPVISDDQYGVWPLVWRVGDRIASDVCTMMYGKTLKDKPVWERNKGIWFGFGFVETDFTGNIRPRYSAVTDIKVRSFTLDQAVSNQNAKIFRNSVLFIGEEHDSIMASAIKTFMCLDTGAVSNTPDHAIWLEKLLIIIFFVYLVFIMPKLRPSVATLILIFAIFSIFVFLCGMLLVKDRWFQLTLPAIYLFVGHILIYYSFKRKNKIEKLQSKTDNAFFKLGRFQYEQNRFELAFESLKECRPKDRIIELLYKLGISLERKRQYDLACSVFNYIKHNKSGYNDVSERADRLSNMIFGRTTTNALSDGGTLEIGNGFSRPVLGRYEIERELGRGAMGIVYLGTDPKIGRKIAIKTMDFTRTFEGRFEEVKDRFFREAKAAGRLTHPNIVTIYDAGEEQDLAYIAMDFVDGLTLNSYARENSLLPVAEVFQIIFQAADALDYAHKQSIIHRDIKPSNIIYDKPNNNIVITDFGIARIADNTTTRPGIILGSPSFMSPEQLKGQEIDGCADIFSLGVTMYQLLTGHLPFKGTDLSSLGYQITSVKHVSVRSVRPDLPTSAERIINKALQKSPEKRYQSAGSMARVLKTEIRSMKE